MPTGDSVSVDRKENAVSGARLLLLKCTAAFKRQHPIPHRFPTDKRAAGAFLGQSSGRPASSHQKSLRDLRPSAQASPTSGGTHRH